MSNAPKTGFWQTIPGMMTAMAGLLSAATGAIVALNNTGVVDLKKVVGNKPPEQSTPLVTPNVAVPLAEGPRGAELSPGGTGESAKPVEPVRQLEIAPPVSAVVSGGTSAVNETPPRPVETKPQEAAQTAPVVVSKPPDAPPVASAEPKPDTPSTPPPGAATMDEERLRAIREGAAAASVTKEQKPQASSAPPTAPTATAKREVPPPVPGEDRVVETRPLPSNPVPATPSRDTERSTTTTESRTVESPPHVVKPPPSPPSAHRGTVARPDPKDRMADARSAERMPPRPEEDPRGAKVVRPPGAPAAGRDRRLDLAGLKLAIPSGWVREEVEPGPLAPVAVLRIPDPSGDGTVRVARHLGARGPELEERSIDRWVGQVTKANGAPAGRNDARVERIQVGAIRITTVDLTGTVKKSPRDTGEPGQRMVSAIIDHPAGSHLVTIVGPTHSMSKWDAAIDGFLRSAKPE